MIALFSMLGSSGTPFPLSLGNLTECSTELASIIDFFGSRFDQAKISVARTTLEAEDARE